MIFQLYSPVIHIDANGFIWLNLDAGEEPEISWEDDFKGIDLQPDVDLPSTAYELRLEPEGTSE
jgi:hypothetical protein